MNFTLLKNKNFLFFIGARTAMVLTFQIVGTIAQWQVYAATRDSLYIGFLALTEVIPAILMNLVGGYAADTFSRKRMALIGSCFTTTSVFILVSTSGSHHLESIVPLFVATFVNGLGRGIVAPASTALLGDIVDRNFYARAAVFNSIAWQMSIISGPAMAGIVYEKFTPLLCYQIALALTCLSML
ncbi:MAG TPA: MFS transporter, partial [Turneriella sp.]|nr:MFS transporter [Turneriella sp.]